MLQIKCPWCGLREGVEFHYHGEAHITRPSHEEENLENWVGYMYERENTAGWQRDLWSHDAGCGRYFNVIRNSITDEIADTYKIGEKPKALPKEG